MAEEEEEVEDELEDTGSEDAGSVTPGSEVTEGVISPVTSPVISPVGLLIWEEEDVPEADEEFPDDGFGVAVAFTVPLPEWLVISGTVGTGSNGWVLPYKNL